MLGELAKGFIKYDICDFISIYNFSLTLEKEQNNGREDYPRYHLNQLEILLNDLGKSDVETHISEWGMTVSNRNRMNDSIFKGAFVVKECLDALERVDLIGHWLGTDLYAEFKDETSILFGGAGLLTRDGIRKPAFYGIKFMNQLEKYIIGKDGYAIVTTDGYGDYKIVCHNYNHPPSGYFYSTIYSYEIIENY